MLDSNPSLYHTLYVPAETNRLADLRSDRDEILDVYRDSDEQECAFFDAELARLAAEIASLELVNVALAAIATAHVNDTPVIVVDVRRDVREFGVTRTRFVGGWERGHSETYRHEQTRFAFAPEFVSEVVEVAVIDESCGQFQLELASEQHLWATHKDWTHDLVPTVVAEVDGDGVFRSRGIFSVCGLTSV